MVDPLTVGATVAASVSALSSVVQAFKAAKDIMSAADVDDALAKSVPPKDMATTLKKLIDGELLETLNENIDKAKKRLIKALKDPGNSQQAKTDEVAVANSVICSTLEQIKMLNGGVLPDETFEEMWNTHGCDGCP